VHMCVRSRKTASLSKQVKAVSDESGPLLQYPQQSDIPRNSVNFPGSPLESGLKESESPGESRDVCVDSGGLSFRGIYSSGLFFYRGFG
jgi:hypothetical protein